MIFHAITAALALMAPDPLAEALDARMRYGNGQHYRSCRTAPGGCRARLEAFSAMFREAGEADMIDPWLLAAMALSESRLNPWAEGPGGEFGILQLHPARRDARSLRLWRSRAYRRDCRRRADACQTQVVRLASAILRRSLERCETQEQALRMYNTGRCKGGTSYPKRVARELARLAPFRPLNKQ